MSQLAPARARCWVGGLPAHSTLRLGASPRAPQLVVGNTVFVRYAARCYFSDLATEAIKVEDLK